MGSILKEMYGNAEDKMQVASIHIFGIKYGRNIIENEFKAPDIISRIKLHLRLLEREHQKQAPLDKGLSEATMQLVLDSLKEGGDYMTVNEVARSSGLAYQTVYRYLQYLIQNKKVEMVSIYGKVGRPRQLFRWVENM